MPLPPRMASSKYRFPGPSTIGLPRGAVLDVSPFSAQFLDKQFLGDILGNHCNKCIRTFLGCKSHPCQHAFMRRYHDGCRRFVASRKGATTPAMSKISSVRGKIARAFECSDCENRASPAAIAILARRIRWRETNRRDRHPRSKHPCRLRRCAYATSFHERLHADHGARATNDAHASPADRRRRDSTRHTLHSSYTPRRAGDRQQR